MMSSNREEKQVGRRTALAVGAATAASVAGSILPSDRALAWAKPAIRTAVGVPASASSEEPWRDLSITIVSGERTTETVRRITLVVTFSEDNSIAAGVGVYGDSQTLPAFLVAVWHPTLEPNSPQYGYTEADGTVTFYSRADASSPEIRNIFFSASLEKENQVLALGNRAWFPDTLPDWVNGPWLE
jgi:hypothetical protein